MIKRILAVLMIAVFLAPYGVEAQDRGREWGQNTKRFNEEQRLQKQEFMKSGEQTKEAKKEFQAVRQETKKAFMKGDRTGTTPPPDGGTD